MPSGLLGELAEQTRKMAGRARRRIAGRARIALFIWNLQGARARQALTRTAPAGAPRWTRWYHSGQNEKPLILLAYNILPMPAKRILIIEDDAKLAELVRLYLERDGYRITIAHDGREGLALARQRLPDLVILDLMLPGLAGGEILKQLRSESPVPIIMLTAKATED